MSDQALHPTNHCVKFGCNNALLELKNNFWCCPKCKGTYGADAMGSPEETKAHDPLREAIKIIELFMEWKAPERRYLPDERNNYTDADYCPHCYGEHHVENHRSDCPLVAARGFLGRAR